MSDGSRWDDWLLERSRVRDERGTQRDEHVLRFGSRPTLDLASNDYLGLSTDPRVLAAAHEALDAYGASATASRLVTGTTPAHRAAEHAVGALTGWDSCLVFSSGYAANVGVFSALASRGTHFVLDAHAHASMHDGARMSRCPHSTFAHNDVAALEAELARLEAEGVERVVVAVESVYSVLGDLADLPALHALCQRHDALLVVDEAHGLGVVGDGRGLVHATGLAQAPGLLMTATLSKALAAQGGAVLSSPAMRAHLVNTSRSFIFDTGLAPAAAAAAARAAEIVLAEAGLAEGIHRNAAIITDVLGVERSEGSVQSVPMPTPDSGITVRERLREQGVLIGCFRPPSVPDGITRLRITARGDLAEADVRAAADLVRRTCEEVVP